MLLHRIAAVCLLCTPQKKILNERRFAWIHRNYCLLLPRKTFQGGVSPGQSCKITFAFISKELADAIIGTVENSPRKIHLNIWHSIP